MMDKNYSLLLKQAEALVSGESDLIANMANISSLLFNSVNDVNWVGFYLYKDPELVLGPFNGQPACTRIPVGKGVCGTAYSEQKTHLINDVHAFEGHIACDAASESEVVVPFNQGDFSGVLDVDSPIKGRFGDQEKELFEAIASLISAV